MFGYHKAKRERKRAKREQEEINKEREFLENQKPELEKKNEEAIKNQVSEDVATAKTERQQAREEGRKYAEDVLNREVQGLTPEEKRAMQYEANKQVKRSMQSANRKLLGEQSTHGITPDSGVAYAQQRDIQRLGNEAYGQNTRDINQLDADLALKKLAAMFNIEQGEASQAALDKQLALDQLRLDEERRRNRYWEDKFNRSFSRV